MAFYIGQNLVESLYIGVNPVNRIYVGTNLVFSSDFTEPFAFTGVPDADLSTLYTSNWVEYTGLAATSISVTAGGEYQTADDDSGTNPSAWLTTSGNIDAGRWFRVRGISGSTYNAETNITLTVGGIEGSYTITTLGITADSVGVFTEFRGVPLSGSLLLDLDNDDNADRIITAVEKSQLENGPIFDTAASLVEAEGVLTINPGYPVFGTGGQAFSWALTRPNGTVLASATLSIDPDTYELVEADEGLLLTLTSSASDDNSTTVDEVPVPTTSVATYFVSGTSGWQLVDNSDGTFDITDTPAPEPALELLNNADGTFDAEIA